jgi:uncharacterized protein with ParB-like and HNH nuclease domain
VKIAELINRLNVTYFLPSIQREFVWLNNKNEQRIEKLFDSILQEYPIGNIMVWRVNKPKGERLKFTTYKFIENYSDESVNEETDLNGVDEPNLVLDGQQRLTALLIGLKGRYLYKRYNQAYETRLYINIFGDLEDQEENTYGLKYEFSLHSANDEIYSEQTQGGLKLWLRVGTVLDFKDTNAELFKNKFKEIINTSTEDEEIRTRALIILGHLHFCICANDAISIVPVETKSDLDQDKNLDRVLNIFVRANDGGVKLEKSDLLLSFMESHRELFMPNGARKEILAFVDSLNTVELNKPNYKFSKDDILKASLMISGINLRYKVSNFTSDNLRRISDSWENIKKSLTLTVELLAKYEFSDKNITSKNALLPIAYYIHHNRFNKNLIELNRVEEKNYRELLISWLMRAMISGLFSGSSDTTLENARKSIDEKNELLKVDSLDQDDIKYLIMHSGYKTAYSDLILKLVSPVNLWSDYQQDHIHPQIKFKSELNQLCLSNEDKALFQKKMNSIGNICLLKPRENNDKRAETLEGWLNDQAEEVRSNLLIPSNVSLEFKDFLKFVDARENLIQEKLNSVVGFNRK